MLKSDISYKKELIEQLNNIKIKRIDRQTGFLAYVFDAIDDTKLSYTNIKSPAIEMLVYTEDNNIEFLLLWSEYAKELQILNLYGNEHLELHDFSNIAFI